MRYVDLCIYPFICLCASTMCFGAFYSWILVGGDWMIFHWPQALQSTASATVRSSSGEQNTQLCIIYDTKHCVLVSFPCEILVCNILTVYYFKYSVYAVLWRLLSGHFTINSTPSFVNRTLHFVYFTPIIKLIKRRKKLFGWYCQFILYNLNL